MDEEVVNDLFKRAVSQGYKKDIASFKILLKDDSEVFEDNYNYVKSQGYKKDATEFSNLVGVSNEPVKKKDSFSENQPLVSDLETGTSDALKATGDKPLIPVDQSSEVDGINVMDFTPNIDKQDPITFKEEKTATQIPRKPSLSKDVDKPIDATMLERAAGVERLDDNSIINETKAALPGSEVSKARNETKAQNDLDLALAEYLVREMDLPIKPSELVKDKERMKTLAITNKKTSTQDPYADLRESAKHMKDISPKTREAAEALGQEWNPNVAAEIEKKIKDKEKIIALRDTYASEVLTGLKNVRKETAELKALNEANGDEKLAKKNLKKEIDEVGELFLTETETAIVRLEESRNKLDAIINGGGELTDDQNKEYRRLNYAISEQKKSKNYGTLNMFDPVSGEYLQNASSQTTTDFKEALKEEFLTYENSGRGDMTKRRDELYYELQTEVMDILLRQQPKDRDPINLKRDKDGNVIPMTKDEIKIQAERYSKSAWQSYGALMTGGSRNSGDFSDWINILNSPNLYSDEQKADANALFARFVGINRALNLNEDPGSLKEGGFLEGVIETFDARLDGTSGEKYAKTEAFINELPSMGVDITEQQKKELGESFSKTLGSTVAESSLVMADIAASTYLLGGVGGAARIPARIKKLSQTLGGGNKVMQFGYNMALQSAAYELAGQSGFSGGGEYVAETGAGALLDKLGSKNAMLNFVLKLAAGTTGETVAEYVGGFAENLATSGDIKKATEDTFGKTTDDAAKIFGLTFITSLMFSSVGLTGREIAQSRTNARNMLVESGSQNPVVTDIIETLTKEIETAKSDLTKEKDKAIGLVRDAITLAEKDGSEATVSGAVVTEETIKEIENEYEERLTELGGLTLDAEPKQSLSEPKPTTKALSRILKIEDGQTSEITVGDKKVGEITTETVGDKVHVRRIDVEADSQKKGHAKQAYKDAQIEAEKDGKTLASDKLQTNDSAKGVWESLVKDGDAVKNEDGTFEMKKAPVNTDITAENSSNYANMTEDEDGNFVFFHVGEKGYEEVRPGTGGKGSVTSTGESSAIAKVGGVAMYFTNDDKGDTTTKTGAKYAVKVPKEKVYDFNNDPLNFYDEAKKRHEEEHPGGGFDPNTQMAYITKIAGENGFDMVVGEWFGSTRAQTTKSLKPSDTREMNGNTVTKDFEEKFKGNNKKGYESVIPETRNKKLSNVYDKINKERNKEGKYDNMYHLRETAAKGKISQEEITKQIEESNISPELKAEYTEALNAKIDSRSSKQNIVASPKGKLFNEPNKETAELSKKYKEKNGIEDDGGSNITSVDEAKAKEIADAYENMEDTPSDPKVQKAYKLLAEETLSQYEEIVAAGYEVEIYEGHEEPYANSAEMLKDLKENKHLYIFSTEIGFGETAITDKQRSQNAMLQDSKMKDKNGKTLLYNDVFRFVHDFFGHSERGNGFGVIGEENAWDVHSRMYSPLARRAMTTETRGQNSWVNFGKQVRNNKGEVIKKGEKGYLAPKDRAFAPQKMGLLPEKFSDTKVDSHSQGVDSLVASFKDTSKVEEQVEKAKKAIAKVSPNTKIVVHKTAEDYKKSGKNRKQNEGGEYDIESDTIHINLESANERTVAHEVFHAILLNKGMSDKQAQSVTKKMLEAVKKTATPELLARLEEFSSNYESALQSEESIAELFGILASEYETLPAPTKNLIKRWLDKLAKIFGLKSFTDNEIVDMLNVVSEKVNEGSEIQESDIKPLRDVDIDKEFEGGIPVEELFDSAQEQGSGGQVGVFKLGNRKQKAPSVSGDNRSFSSLIKEANLEDFSGKKFITNMYDFTGAGEVELAPGITLDLYGGKSYVPLMMDKQGLKIGDKSNLAAFNSKANAEGFIRNSMSSGAELFAPHVGTKEGSWQFQQNLFEQLMYAVLNNNILTNKQLIKVFNSAISSKNGKAAFKTFKENSGQNIRNLSSFSNNPEQLIELLNTENNYSPDLRKILNDKLAGDKVFQKAIGVKNKVQFSEKFEDPLNVGSQGGDLIGLVEFDNKTFEVSKPKKTDPDYHPSFAWTVKANINGIYQPTDFHQSTNATETYTKYNKDEVSVSEKSKVGADEFAKSNVSSSAGSIPKVAEVSLSRKQNPNRPTIEAVRKKAQELGLSKEQLMEALTKLGYTKAEINSTREQTMSDATDKFNMSQKKGNPKSASEKAAMGDLKSTNWYRMATDTERETAVRDLRKAFNIKEKTAPSTKKILGDKSKTEKQTKTVKSLRKEFWKMWNKSFRESKMDQDAKRREVSEAISDIINESRDDITIKKKKLNAIQKRISKTNLNNPVMVERLLNYISKTIESADHIAKISEANKNKTRIRKLTKGGKKDANLTASAKAFIQIDPNLVDDIDLYLEKSNAVVNGLKSSVITASKSNVSAKFNVSEMDTYTEGELLSQREKIKESVEKYFEELTGISDSGLSLSEMMETIDDSKEAKPDVSKLDPIQKANIKKAYDAYASIVLSMAETNTDPFTGESLGLSKEEIELATELSNLNTLEMDKAESIKAIDALSNFSVNQSLAGAQSIVSKATGDQNASKLSKDGVKSRKLKQYFSKRIGRLLVEQFTSLPIALERMFGKSKSLVLSRLSGLTGVINGNAKATKMSEKIVSSYLSKFGKTKPNGQAFNTAENIHERGLIAFIMRTVNGNEEAEFERRKGWIEQSIAKLSEGTVEDKVKAESYQKVYDKLLKDSSSVSEVIVKSDKNNVAAVNWWVKEWSKHYDQLQKTNLEVYNEVLDSDGNYTPDVTKKMDESREVDLLQSTFSSAAGRLDKSKSGSLIKATKPTKIPLDRYISLDFDVNNANTIQSALTDINTAKDIMKLQGFLNSPALKKLIETKEDQDLFKSRISDYVASVKRSNHVDRSELNTISKGLEIAAAVGVARALGGITQGVKQTVPVMLNTLINSGRLDFGNLFSPEMRAFIDNSGMPIANRGMASQASLDHIERLLEKASKTKGGALIKNLEDLQRFYLKMFLQKPDVFVARAAFISYYKQALKKRGKKVEDWSTHEIDQEAADYAQQQVDRQQNVSDEYLQGKLFTSKEPLVKLIRKVAFPFANFAMNQKSRMATDMISLAAKTTSKSDRISSMRSLSGLAVEMMAFYSLRIALAAGIWEAAKAWMDYDEDDEEAKMRMKSQLKGAQTAMVKDLLSPAPMFDSPIVAGLNKLLNIAQGDLERDKNGNIKKGQEENFEFYGKWEEGLWDDWGVLGISIDKIDAMIEKTETAVTGKYIDKKWNKEYTLTEKNQEGMQAAAIIDILYNFPGLLPSEFGTLSNNIEKIAKKR